MTSKLGIMVIGFMTSKTTDDLGAATYSCKTPLGD
jgi:hypothetical protein